VTIAKKAKLLIRNIIIGVEYLNKRVIKIVLDSVTDKELLEIIPKITKFQMR